MKLSVIIVNYNVKFFLEQALLSVRKALAGIDGEVWVVDNNSVDGSVNMLHDKFPDVKLIANTQNTGFAKANNQAIVESSGEYVLLLNPDTVVEEDTFTKVIEFMDAHPDAGGLGVKMIDGKGRFLPESKRGLPTPAVAFYKIFGLAALFPKSRTFGRYHLGYLDKDEVNEVDVLAGAFMLLRKATLDKVGMLDEDFFMYGEDIDLSYRITRGGFKNYYFPDTRIIHYKGESTKKSSINYVFVFYNAMVIFARKHFSAQHANLFSFLINIAIYVRAAMALAIRFMKHIALPLADALMIYGGIFLLKEYWEYNIKYIQGGHYPTEYMALVVPAYILVWIASVFLSGGYDKPISLSRIVRGIFTGTLAILVVYGLLSETYRFSRALILLGAVWATISMLSMRLILSMAWPRVFATEGAAKKKTVIVGSAVEARRVLSLLKLADTQTQFLGYLTSMEPTENERDMEEFLLGREDQLDEIISLYKIDEVIFCAIDVSSQAIIDRMTNHHHRDIEYKIAPPESLYIIGSNSVDNPGELYMVDINAISKAGNRRKKRLMDVCLCMAQVVVSPVMILVVRERGGWLLNLLDVLRGKATWVGVPATTGRNCVLTPADGVKSEVNDEKLLARLNSLYIKDYRPANDLFIILHNLRKLGHRKRLR